MRYKGKHFREKLPQKSTPKAKMEIEHITSTPMSFTEADHYYPPNNLAIPSDEGVEGGREFVIENKK